MSIGNINSTSGYYFQNNTKAHRDLISYLGGSELLKNTDDEIVNGGFKGVLSRAEDLLDNDKKNDIKKKYNTIKNIETEAFFKIKKSLIDSHGSCSVCHFSYEHCHC